MSAAKRMTAMQALRQLASNDGEVPTTEAVEAAMSAVAMMTGPRVVECRTAGEATILRVLLAELRVAMRARRQFTITVDPWLPKGCTGATIVAQQDPKSRVYEIDGVRTRRRA